MQQKFYALFLVFTIISSSMLMGAQPVVDTPEPAQQQNIQRYLWKLFNEEPNGVIDVIIRKNSTNDAAERIIQSTGGAVKQVFEFINGFSATIPLRTIPALSTLDSVQWVSIDSPVRSTNTDVMGTLSVTDNFTDYRFDSSEGAPLWSSVWSEIGEADGAQDGDVAVVDFWGGALIGLRLQASQRGVVRSVDLTKVAAANLAIAFRRKDFVTLNDFVRLEISSDGGASWVMIDQFVGPVNDAAIQNAAYDLSQFADAPLAIRFVTSDSLNPDARFYLDSVTLQVTPASGEELVKQVYLPVVSGGSSNDAVVQAAALINVTALVNTFVKEIGADRLWNETPNRQGTNSTVAVVDSGIALHNDLKTGTTSRIIASVQFGSASSSIDDNYGHGTHVAGIIAGNGTRSAGQFIGIAPAAQLVDVKVTNDFGVGSTADVVAGLQWIYTNRALYNIKVVNLSMNSVVAESYHESALNAALEVLWFNGIVVVVSSGNLGSDKIYPPANDPFVITVGATDDRNTTTADDDTVPNYSAYGVTSDGFVKPDIVAPGHNITSLLAGDDNTLKRLFPTKIKKANNGVEYLQISGTSMASAVVAGAVALLLEDEPGLNPDQVKYRLKATARAIGGTENCTTGAGVLDIYAAVRGTTTQSANSGTIASQLLWSGTEPVAWNSVNWNSVNWNSINWNSINWNSINWNSTAVTDILGLSGSCNGGLSGRAVTYLTLMDADSDKDLLALSDGAVIDLAKLSTSNLTLRAGVRGSIQSTKMDWNNGAYVKTDNSAPYSLYGESNGNYLGAPVTLGSHRMAVTPYGSILGTSPGDSLTVDYTIIDSRNSNRFATTLVAPNSTLCMDIPGSTTTTGTQLQQTTCNNSNAQNFQFEPVTGRVKTYMIKNRGNGLCLDISDAAMTDNSPLIQYSCTGTRNQQFVMRPIADKRTSFYLIAAHSGKCLAVAGNSTSAGGQLVQSTCTNQTWTLDGFVQNNLLSNGNFESQLTGWQKYTSTGEQIISDAAESSSALNMVGNGSGADQNFNVLPGKVYLMSISTKSSDSGWSGFGISYFDRDWKSIQGSSAEATTADRFSRTKLYTIAPANAAYGLVWIKKAGSDGYFYADQVAVEELSDVTPPKCSASNGAQLSNVTFSNTRLLPVSIRLIDANCNEVTKKSLSGGQKWTVTTTENSVWRVRDSLGISVLLEGTATNPWQTFFID